MRKIVFISLLIALFTACNKQPSGNPEEDAKEFVSAFIKAYNNSDIETGTELIDKYYNFYKDKNPIDIRVFFNVIKDEMRPQIDDMESMAEFGENTDKYDKFEQLLRMSRK